MSGKVVGLIAATVIPPAAAAGLWRTLVAEHPLVAALLLLGYEAAVALVAFSWKIVEQLAKRWQQRIVDNLDQSLRVCFSRFPTRYRAALLGNVRYIDVKGLDTIGFYTPELDEVFVHVSLAHQAPDGAESGLLTHLPPAATDRHALGDFLDRRRPVVLAIVGAPGSGKTTLLRRTAREICQEYRGRRRTVPLLLFLRDHVGTVLLAPEVTLADLVRQTLEPGIGEPAGWFEQKLRGGDCVVLLDGLDEVARQDDRKALAVWLEHQIALYPLNDYIITSRPQGYRSARINGAAVLQVRSLTDDQVTSFVHGWYLAVERFTAGTENTEVRRKAQTATDDLLERLNNTPALLDLTINPLLLTMIANVHRHRGALPGSRTRLYSEICEVVLWRRQEEKGLVGRMGGDEKEILLRSLAFSMMERRVRDLPRQAVLTAIEPLLRRMPAHLTAEEFLADVGSSGLLVERESGLYSFAHHTFQEYLAAAHLRGTGRSDLLAAAVDDVWWRESTLLYVVGSDADAVVEAGLASGSVTALSLAFDCAEQGSHLAPDLRDRLDSLLGSTFAVDTDRDRLRLMASVMATRQLRHLIRTRGGGRVAVRPVPEGLYWLFRQDTGALPPDGTATRQGETDSAPSRADAERPATGVRSQDAVAFVRWLNGVTSHSPGYRLPTRVEIEDPAVQRCWYPARRDTPPAGLWLAPDDEPGRPQLWTPSGSPHPYAMEPDALARSVANDLGRAGPTLARLLLLRALVAVRLLPRGLDTIPTLDAVVEDLLDRLHDLVWTLRRAAELEPARARGDQYEVAFAKADELGAEIRNGTWRESADGIVSALLQLLTALLETWRVRDRADAVELILRPGRVLAQEPAADHAFERALEQAMGTALSSAVTHGLRTAAHPNHWNTDFSRKFIAGTGAKNLSCRVSPDELADLARETSTAFTRLLESSREAVPPSWANAVNEDLGRSAPPIFEGRHPLTARAASEVRITALCLAVEAEARDAPDLGAAFRRVALGTTLLEERVTGDRPPNEMIALASL
ncbi:NACHT domain-containing protein [Streptomyces sp. YU58]|uniref:NACHT domain-containing protein n=1 Tax=Streptomyces sp. SX92 TaxID=3158972 RepID=UPI0027B9CFD6|nr:NACHT domain-containing protein [Streptomyces coralus]WLW56013.1 NACHT domain-containing protein [Streptomyces coralus]